MKNIRVFPTDDLEIGTMTFGDIKLLGVRFADDDGMAEIALSLDQARVLREGLDRAIREFHSY